MESPCTYKIFEKCFCYWCIVMKLIHPLILFMFSFHKFILQLIQCRTMYKASVHVSFTFMFNVSSITATVRLYRYNTVYTVTIG